MNILTSLILISLSFMAYADDCPRCCQGHGGILYSDSSMGRFVCNDGETSHCHSTRHAVMEMQKFTGCCLWSGGVSKMNSKGQVLCRDGGYSEICTISRPHETLAVF
jgi:hypothetical protein